MPRQELLIQLITEGRPGWQVRVEVSKSLCRKMTNNELGRLGTSTVNELAAIIHDGETSAPAKQVESFVKTGQAAQKAVDDAIATGKKKR